MQPNLYEDRCRCNEELSIEKEKASVVLQSEGKPLKYPNSNDILLLSKTFQIKYEKKLSLIAKLVLNSFQNKYIYYAIDDILYLFELNKHERENLLAILYSPILSLQNNYSVNFFDIWIKEIYIDEISKKNKFLITDSPTSKPFSYITIKLFYKTPVPLKKQELLW
jgi:hypothetical protein